MEGTGRIERLPLPLCAGLALALAGATSWACVPSATDAFSEPVSPQRVENGRTRVLVELKVADRDAARRDEAIAATQDAVLARLPAGHAALVRRYATVPLLALEVDAQTLRALESMSDLVVRVTPDMPTRPQPR